MLRIRQSIRYFKIPRTQARQFAQCSISLNEYHTHQLESLHLQKDLKIQINTLLENVPKRSDKQNPIIFEDIVTQLPAHQSSIIAASLLSVINANSKNKLLLKLLLETVQAKDISEKGLANVVRLVHEFSTHSAVSSTIRNRFADILLERCNDDIINALKEGISEFEGGLNKYILVTLYLKTKQYDEAHDLVLDALVQKRKITHSSIELVIHHSCHLGEIERAAVLLELAIKQRYTIYPRTLSILIAKAIERNDYKICSKFQHHVMKRTYVDNGTLVRLVETLVPSKQYLHLKGLKKLAETKGSFPGEFMIRINRSIVDCAALVSDFEKVWKMLEGYHKGEELEVADYPNLKALLDTSDSEALNQFLLQKMVLTEPTLKRFILNLVVARLCEESRVDTALALINNSPVLLATVSENTILQLIHGADLTQNSTMLSQIFELIIKRDIRFRQRKTIELILSTFLDSEYWFLSFKMLERCEIPGYKVRRENFVKMESKCKELNSTQYLKYK